MICTRVQYLCAFVCTRSCLLVWLGLCVLPNIYCHNDVWLLREQGFHSREKRGLSRQQVGPPFVSLFERSANTYSCTQYAHNSTHLFVIFVWVACINKKIFFFLRLRCKQRARGKKQRKVSRTKRGGRSLQEPMPCYFSSIPGRG